MIRKSSLQNTSDAQTDYLFVYGTLRRAALSPMHVVMQRCTEFAVDAYMQGRLYQIDGYPGLVLSDNPADRVLGELYRVLDPQLWSHLDDYEQCTDDYPEPHEFIRKKQQACAQQHQQHYLAWVYLFNHDINGRQLIQSGDYLRS